MNLTRTPTIELVRELLRRFDKHVFAECEDSFVKLSMEIDEAAEYAHEDIRYGA